MTNASVVFLPWVRQGLAARVTGADPLKTPLPAQAPLTVALGVNNADAASMQVRLFGPADVLGLDPRQVVRTEPPANTSDYESNDLAAIEFDNPDLPWLFTPAAADAQGRLRPWLVLVVVRKQDGVRLRPAREEPLPVLEIAPPAAPALELPDLADSWAWAHAQLGAHEGASDPELRGILATRPELSVSRLLSARLLAPFTDYVACVVPAFESGRLAGLGKNPDPSAALAPAWSIAPGSPGTVSLPVYYHWDFRTGAREDFESIVARLAPRDFSDTVGRRPIDISQPGFLVPDTAAKTLMLEGALQPVKAQRIAFPDGGSKPWQDKLQSILNAASARAAEANAEPVLGPPIYGRYYANRSQVGTLATRDWLDQLNLDPRDRVVAALGTAVIQDQQEDLMAQAWDQAGEMAQANQRLRQMQLSLAITSSLHTRHVMRMTNDDMLWRFAAPAQARLIMPAAAPGAAAMSMRSMLAASSTPQVVTSAAMRRLSRPGGAISRRAAVAVRTAGMSAPATPITTGISSMFRLYGAQPWVMFFTLPPTRGLVSFDAVTRRLPTQFSGMTYARATDAAVNGMPPRPAFVVQGEPTPIIGIVHGTLGRAATTRTARATSARKARTTLRPIGDPPDPDDPPDPRPRPRPEDPPAPRIDSADAKAFRAAAVRHLGVVNPQQPIVFHVPGQRIVLNAAAAQPQIRALLDPAPALKLKMAATIRVAGDQSPPDVGPLGGTPVFTQPMSELLAAVSQDWLLPGLERVPVDSVALLEPNERFIEAFMLGLNVEMGRELLWRDFPVSDQRASYFRRFWRTVNPKADGDIAPIAQWGNRNFGENAAVPNSKQVVLLVRSVLFRRYPSAIVYAVPAVPQGDGRKPGDQSLEVHPLFRGALQPDVTFFGFDIDADAAIGNPGWYFVIQEQPTEPRFGFDVEIDFGTATHVPLGAPPTGHALPAGTKWAFNAAHMANAIRQQPVRIAIHASELIKNQ